MKTDHTLTDKTLLDELGLRLASLRLSQNLTQSQLAEQAGLGLRTIQRMEVGASATQLSSFLRVCRVLGILDRFDRLIPTSEPGPMELLESRGKARQRAKGSQGAKKSGRDWTWSDG